MKKSKRHSFILLMLVMGLVVGTASMLARRANASPAAVSPTNASSTTNVPLPGDATIGPAARNQEAPQIAAGAGGYLVVWEDSRTNYTGALGIQSCPGGEPCGQSLKDIYAARLDADGNLIDTTPIVVSQSTWDQTRPRVAWNGQNWLVVWSTSRVANFSSTVDVMAARVSPQGVVLDNPAIVVDDNPAVDELFPTVASDGNNWVVVWMDQGSYYELDAARIAPDGTNLNPGGVQLYTPQFPRAPYNVSIAFAQDEYLLAWQEYRSNADEIVGMRITPNLQRIDQSPFVISAALDYQIKPSVASNGTDFLVAWSDNRSLQVHQAFAARVTHAGQVLDPNGIELNYYFTSAVNQVDAEWDGTQWFVAWDDSDPDGLNVYAARVSTAGAVLDYDGFPVAQGPRNQGYPALASMLSGGVRVAWMDDNAAGAAPMDIYSASVSANRVVGAPAPTSLGAPSQRQPDFAAGSNGYLAVFLSEISGETRIKAQRLDANGNATDSEPLLIAGGSRTLRNPAVAWNGTLYLIVWEDNSTGQGFVPGTIYGKRVLPDGTILDPNPITIMYGNTPDVAALDANFLVVNTHEPTNHQRVPKATRVSSAGVVLDSPVTIGSIYARYPHVAALGGRWLAVWQRNPTHDNPSATVYAAFINADGTTTGQFQVAGSVSKTPNLATGPNQGLIAFYNSGDVRARRILPDGTLLDGSTGFAVTSAANDQFLPALAWNGNEYVVAYEDYRSVLYLDKPRSDVYATRVDINAQVLDPTGFPIGNDSTPEVQPAVAALNGSYIIGYADFRDTAPYAAYRIDVLGYQPGTTPTPVPSNTATSIPSTATSTAAPPTATGTSVPPTATGTIVPSSTTTAVPPTATSTTVPPTSTRTSVPPTATSIPPTATMVPPTATTTPEVCSITFTDVPQGHTFYSSVYCLACRGIISGYADGTFKPDNLVTRGQLAKIVSNAANFTESPGTQIFQDVPTDHTFYEWINRLTNRGYMSGYTCGSPGEPCVSNRPYFRPFANATRAQTSKIVSNAAVYNDAPTGQTFEDVPPTHPFYVEIQRLASRNIMGGYSCGGPGEPCINDRPYFRPYNNVTRGQSSKIVANTFYPGCNP